MRHVSLSKKWGHYCGFRVGFSTVFLNVSSTCMSRRMQSHTDCICLSCLHCGLLMSPNIAFITVNLSNAPSNCLAERMQHHIGCSYLTFPHNVFFFNIYPQNGQSKSMQYCHKNVFVKTFPTLCFDMSPRKTFLSRYIVTLVAFV